MRARKVIMFRSAGDKNCSSECIDTKTTSSDISQIGNLEIHVELPSRNREKKTKTQKDIEMALKRRFNHDIRKRQAFLHKASLLCHFGRIFFYNRLLNDTILMPKALKLLPSKYAYPPEQGTEIKYFQSMVTWFKSTIKLKKQNLYPEKSAAKTKTKAHIELLKQIEKKEARCKQDMIFIFIILLRGMGLQCRLIVNMQPLPLKPRQSDLLTINQKDKRLEISSKNGKKEDQGSDLRTDSELKPSSSKTKVTKLKSKSVNFKEMENRENNKDNKSESCDKNVKHSKKMSQECNVKNVIDEKTKTSSSSALIAKSPKQTGKNKIDLLSKEISESKKKDLKEVEAKTNKTTTKSRGISENKVLEPSSEDICIEKNNCSKDLECSQKENKTKTLSKPTLSRLKRTKANDKNNTQEENPNKKPAIEAGSLVIPKIVVQGGKDQNPVEQPTTSRQTRSSRSRSKSPQAHISTAFLLQSSHYKDKFAGIIAQNTNVKNTKMRAKSPINKVKISTDFLKNPQLGNIQKHVLRSRQKTNEEIPEDKNSEQVEIPQLDGANDIDHENDLLKTQKNKKKRRPKIKKLMVQRNTENSDEDFEPSPPKKPKTAPALAKQDRRVLSSDDENDQVDSAEKAKGKQIAGDMWPEVWCDVEEQWVCVDIFKGKIHCVDLIRKTASPSLAYVFAFQNDLSIKDVTARYCPNWTTVVRKSRVDKAWLDTAICKYLGHRTKRDINEDQELRRIHEEKQMPSAIGDYKNHPFYALERHLLKFQSLYPPNAPALGYIRGQAVYSRDCVHTLHSRDIWLKQARTVKFGEKPYKIVKARPKWDRITQTVIKDQPLEIFGYWQTQEYEPPTAENGLVPRNAYGNVELFKPSMLPKKTKHIRLPGLNRICKKLGIDCANAVIGFDFHQGSCHPTYDGFIVCEEYEDQVVAAWHQDQEEQAIKEQEKFETRVYGNWKKLIRGLLIRERLKLKYNF